MSMGKEYRGTAGARPVAMRAVQFDGFGGPEVLSVRRVPVPRPGAGEVLVRVEASGVNPKDALFREKAAAPWARGGFPRGTGFDLAGEVVEAGAGVARLRPGDAVWGFLDGTIGRAAAEYVTVPERWVAHRPAALAAAEAAAMPLVATAALQALRDVARLRPGDRVLIKGATGGVGRAAIQIAKVLGAEVTAIAAVGRAEYCGATGADAALTEEEVHRRRHPGFDVFLDCAGGSRIGEYSRLLGRGGRWVTVAPNPAVFVLASLALATTALRLPRFGFVVVRPRFADLELLATWVTDGALKPSAVALFPLDDVRRAHEAVARRGKADRPVLAIGPASPPAEASAERMGRLAAKQ